MWTIVFTTQLVVYMNAWLKSNYTSTLTQGNRLSKWLKHNFLISSIQLQWLLLGFNMLQEVIKSQPEELNLLEKFIQAKQTHHTAQRPKDWNLLYNHPSRASSLDQVSGSTQYGLIRHCCAFWAWLRHWKRYSMLEIKVSSNLCIVVLISPTSVRAACKSEENVLWWISGLCLIQ